MMKLIAWAIALAAAVMVPAAAAAQSGNRRRPTSRPRTRPGRARSGDAGQRLARDRRASPASAPAARPRAGPGTTGHMIPTPASACPTAAWASRTRSPRSAGRRGVPRQLAAAAVRGDQRVRPRAAAVDSDPLQPPRQPDAVAQQPQYLARSGLDAGSGADPGGDRDPLDPAARPPIFAAQGGRDDQGHRAPMVLDL